MSTRRTALPFALLALAAPAAAQSLASVTPSRIVAVDPSALGSTRQLTLEGPGITPGASAGEDVARVKFQMRRAGGEWTEPRSAGGGVTHNLWEEVVWSHDWFTTPGTVEVRLLVDGSPTNALPIRVDPAPVTAPEVTELAPSHFAPGQPRSDVYLFYVRGLRYSDPLDVTVAGIPAPVGRMTVDGGEALVYLPESLRNRSGRYPVVVKTRAGQSLPKYVEVDGPPAIAAVEPAEIVKEKAGDGTSVRVKVSFGGAAPTSIRVGSEALGWVSVAPQEWADSPTAVWVDVPMPMVQKAALGAPQAIEIVLANDSGSSRGVVTARSDASNMQVHRAAPGVLRTPAARRPPVSTTRPPVPPAPAPHP